jgi:ABC-2 type transport system permease protein
VLRKILIVARRDYLESIKTKAFIFGLIVAPVLFGSGFIGLALLKNKPDIADRKIALVDRTGKAAATVIEAIREKNEQDLFETGTRKQIMPRYQVETVAPDDAHREEQRLTLSQRVKPTDLYAFIEIGANALHPDAAGEKNPENGIAWYSNETGLGGAKSWFSGALNDGIRRVRLTEAGVDSARFHDLLTGIGVQSMSLVSKDPKTGAIQAAGKRDGHETTVPMALVMMLFLIVVTTSAPMLNGIAEDKMQRVHEMLLASVTPFEMIAGKVLSAVGRSLTSSLVYIAGALFLLNSLTILGMAEIEMIPWFLLYLVAEITMLSAMAAALGAACGSAQDAQSLGMVLFAPVVLPMMMLTQVLEKPNGGLSTILSFIPPFTPMMMMLRQALPGGVPWWQPWVGIVGMTLGVIAFAFAAARIFRVAILLQGKPPSVAELTRWALRG